MVQGSSFHGNCVSCDSFSKRVISKVFAEERYVPGFTPGYPPYPKSVVRGILHKVLVLTSPIWLYMTWPTEHSLCQITYFALTSLSFLAMFISSSVFHHFEFTPKQFDFWRKIDMYMVANATVCNTIPSLMFYELFGSLIMLLLIAVSTGIMVYFWDPRKAMITGISASFGFVSVCIIPNILWQIPAFYTFPLISHMILMIIGLLLFVFGDNDRPCDESVQKLNLPGHIKDNASSQTIMQPRVYRRLLLASHDILHLISVAFFLNFVYFNTLLHQSHLCS